MRSAGTFWLLVWLLAASHPAAAEPTDDQQDLRERVRLLEAELGRLSAALAAPRSAAPATLQVTDGVTLRLTGYADLGAFYPSGDGVAYTRDIGKTQGASYPGYPWIFLGDPWGNPVNSQGDSADLGLDRTVVPRVDPIHSAGKPSFIANLVNLTLNASLGARLLMQASLNFAPRQGTLGAAGDMFDVDLAYLQWRPVGGLDLSIYAGKFDATNGIEYRVRKAPDRFGVTPSLISRYTTGTPVGVKVRGSVLRGHLTYSLAVTNGGMVTEKLGHFSDELDSNFFKTVSGRVSLVQRLGSRRPVAFELGASGAFGAQDGQPRDDRYQWQAGADLQLSVRDFALRAEYMAIRTTVSAQQGGAPATDAPWLRAQGGYGELTYQILPWLGVLGRLDYRNGQLFSAPNLYLSDLLRVTAALRFDITWNVIAKLEYVRLQELSGPELDDDIYTSSLIFRF